MHRLAVLIAVIGSVWAMPPSFAEENPPLETQYLHIFLKLNDSEQLQKQGKYQEALESFEDCHLKLTKIYHDHPEWEPALVIKRIEDCRSKVEELQVHFGVALPMGHLPSTDSAVPLNFSTKTTKYPWKKDIKATEFWIGESASGPDNAWDELWERHYGGSDDPNSRQGYVPAPHSPTLNPFYVALPFNDLAYRSEAKKWVPAGWKGMTKPDGKPGSACKDRWVQIKDSGGDSCYAQWEDVGPNGGHDPEYVFGEAAPKAGAHAAGIDVSPAVAKYLGIEPEGPNSTVSWRFIDAPDVPPGYWLKCDEEAVIYVALHEQAKK